MKYPVAHVEWIDSGIVSTTWEDIAAVTGENLATVKGPIHSAGFVVHEDAEGIVLSLSVNPNHDDVNLSMYIPRVVIREMRVWGGAP